jgi:branched-chain amino acid transport system ATP-binding protein
VPAHAGHSFYFWRNARAEPKLREPARAALARVGLSARADLPASLLSHGEHRQLELAMALAGNPRLLLLDEPMAGLGADESTRMVATLRELKREVAILLVEHDMDAVFALADRITVLVYGRVIATGSPADIRANAAVRDAYLGEAEAAHG